MVSVRSIAVRALVESGALSLGGLITHRSSAEEADLAYRTAFETAVQQNDARLEQYKMKDDVPNLKDYSQGSEMRRAWTCGYTI